MKKRYDFIYFLGLAILLSSVVFIPHSLLQLRTLSIGESVTVKIDELPLNCAGYKNFCRFGWQGKTFVEQVGKDFCLTHKNGDLIQMKYSNDFYDIFLFDFTDFNVILIELLASVLIAVLGGAILRYGHKLPFG
jgi:hypothetical protein